MNLRYQQPSPQSRIKADAALPYVRSGSPLQDATTNFGLYAQDARQTYNRQLAGLLGYGDIPGVNQIAPNVFINPDYYRTGKGSGQVDQVTGQAGGQEQLDMMLQMLTAQRPEQQAGQPVSWQGQQIARQGQQIASGRSTGGGMTGAVIY